MKLSVFLPTIRTHLLENWYKSLEASCNRHEFEVVFCGPFDIPESLSQLSNVTFIKDFGSPTRAAQIAAMYCQGEYLYHTTDDVLFFPEVISNELDIVEENKIVGMRYREGENYNGHALPESYWYAANAYPHLGGVNNSWGICVHFLILKESFHKYGGFDCQWQYLNHAGHDLLFRIQKNEWFSFVLSKEEVCSADWMPNTTGDHAPIHHTQINEDAPLFYRLWGGQNDRSVISVLNYRYEPEVWKPRFTGNETGYGDLK